MFSITGAASIRERKEIPDAIEICKKKIEELKKELEPSDRSAYFAGEEYKEGEEVRFGLLQNITNTVKYYYPESFEDDVKYGYYLSEMGTDAASYKLRIDLGNEQKMDSIPYFILRNEKNGDTVYTTGLSIYPSYNPNNSIILVGAFVKLQQKYIGLKLYRLSQIPTLANMNSDLIQETWKCVDVLLDKHGGQDNEDRDRQGGVPYSLLLSQVITVLHRQVNSDGIKHMDTWKNIRRSIHAVNVPGQLNKNGFSGQVLRPYGKTVGIHIGNQQKHCHPYHPEIHQTTEHFPLTKKEVHPRQRDVHKPEQIGDDEHRQKRDILIQRRTDDMQMLRSYVLKISESCQIKREIQQQQHMFILIQLILHTITFQVLQGRPL